MADLVSPEPSVCTTCMMPACSMLENLCSKTVTCRVGEFGL